MVTPVDIIWWTSEGGEFSQDSRSIVRVFLGFLLAHGIVAQGFVESAHLRVSTSFYPSREPEPGRTHSV
jgi:hypothetical protein